MIAPLVHIQWDKTSRACPDCGRSALWRSRRRGLETMLSWIGVYPYRCIACYKRFYAAGKMQPT